MSVDTAASATLQDADYTNGEQYIYSTLLSEGTHNYFFDTSDGLESASVPSTGNLSGPIVTSTYTPVGTNVVVMPDPAFTITFTEVTVSGDTYVTHNSAGSALPSGYMHGNPAAYFDIWTTATYNGKVRICYTYDDATYFGVGYGGEKGLRWLHIETGAFRDRTVTLDVNNNFVCGEVYTFSEFSAAVEEATLVTLTSFKATDMDGKILLTWSTASEVDSMGFNILRGLSPNGPFERINEWVVRSKGTPTRGMTYTYEDTDIKKGITYYYRLENIDFAGRITAHMIASVTMLPPEAPDIKQQPSEIVSPSETIRTDGLMYEARPQDTLGTGPGEISIIQIETPARTGVESNEIIPESTGTVTEDKKEYKMEGIIEDVAEVHQVVEKTPDAAPKVEVPEYFTLKIEDEMGNKMQVRLPEETETVKDPFDFSLGEDGKITLKWSAKGNLKGFNILRRSGKSKVFNKINILPIPFFASKGDDKGLIYSFKDAGIVTDKKDKLHTYKIETILSDGTKKESKPVEISVPVNR